MEIKKLETATLTCTFDEAHDNVALSMLVWTETNNMIAINAKREVIRDFVL